MKKRSLVTRIASALGACALVVGGVVAGTVPAAAADTASLNVSKTVNNGETATLAPGDEFTFQIRVGCDDVNCVNAETTDTLPAEFEGFDVVTYGVTPGDTSDWQGTITGCDGMVVTNGCGATVKFIEDLGGGAIGLRAGESYTLSVTLRVPNDLSPSWPYNGQTITNTGTGTADNAATKSDTASVVINVPVTVDTATTKSWTPASEQFSPGATSTIALTTQNTSNVPADSLVVQEPAAAEDGAATLDPSNPFLYSDFTGLGTITMPAGATQVQVDAYIYDPDTGTYSWVDGDPGPPADADVPGGPSSYGDVAGIRITYTDPDGNVITPNGAAGGVQINVAQRSTNRDTDASLEDGWNMTNAASSTVTVPDHDSVTKDATADHTVTPVHIAVEAGKSFTPDRIPAGTTSTGTVTAKNTSDGPIESLTVSDTDFFTDDLQFAGFSAPPTFPSASTSAHITWHYSDGSTGTEDFGPGETPVADAPAGAWVTGFEITFDGPIDQGATASVPFTVAPTLDYVPTGESPVTKTNTVDVSGTSGSKSVTDDATADLAVYTPDIDIDLDKSILPSTPVAPGGTVVAELKATTSSDSAFVTPTTITVDDVAPTPHDDASFWNAFNPVEIAPTAIPEGATLDIQYTTDDGATWQTFTGCGAPVSNPPTASYTCDVPPDLQGTITGFRFTFTDPDGFAEGQAVQPNVTFQARADQRYGGGQTSVPDAGPSTYTNGSTAQGEGTAGGETIDSDVVDDSADAQIETHTGEGALIIGKRWTDPTTFSSDKTTIDSQSGEQAGTVLNWGVNSTGFASLTVSDPAVSSADPPVPTDAADSTFQAFDLAAIAPISTTQDPLLKWDSVSLIQLYESGVWTPITPPSGGWMSATGFVGYSLNTTEQGATTGVRITVVPNDAARAASTDPTRPAPGSGISASSTARQFDLVWNLRNKLREPAGDQVWVNGTTVYDTQDAGVVDNVMQSDATELDGTTVGPANADDTIVITDVPPGVDVVKTSQKQTIPVPNPGDVPPSAYPTNDFTITANSTSASRASYVRVTDPPPCGTGSTGNCTSEPDDWAGNPYDGYTYDTSNPFDQFTLTGLSFTFNAAEVDPGKSVVTLLHRSVAGVLSTSTTTISAAQTMTADQLQDVVGVSVVYQGTDPATTGGTITSGDKLVMTMHTQVRERLRSNPSTFVTPTTVSNYAFAQSYDPVLYPEGQGSTPIDTNNADVQLVQGQLDIVAGKAFNPNTELETDRHNPVDVTLTAVQGPEATVSPNQVTIEDTDADFWNEFELTSFTASDVTFPTGADQVRVDVQLNGSSTWTTGTAGPAAALPTVDLGAITGIRFVFDRDDGDIFSHTAPPETFTATAVLHVTLLDTGRDDSEILFPSTITDTVAANSHRTEDSDLYPDANDTADAPFALDPGTFRLDVAKNPQGGTHTVAPGTAVPWTITFTNTGTGILTIPSAVDDLGPNLQWDGADPTYVDSAGGTLSTEVTLEYDRPANTLTFSWPADGQRMQPGETFAITVGIILKPGLTVDQSATNSVVIHTGETLDPSNNRIGCTNNSGNGQGTIADVPATDCGTSNFVQPVPGPALLTSKGVKGDVVDSLVSGAEDPADPMFPCTADGAGYYHNPCVANTRMSGTDEWQLVATNAGTDNYATVTMVDPFPTPGDQLLATGSNRGTTYRPVLDGAFGVKVQAPLLATTTVQVSTDARVCIGSNPSTTEWSTDKTCSADTWVDAAGYTGSWDAVTGMRVSIDLTRIGGLAPGGTVSVTFRTINEPVSSAHPDGLPTTVPASTEYAYNQMGIQATLTDGANPLAQAPVKVGVTPSSGPLMVNKEVTGDDAQRAPDAFQAGVTCLVGETELQLGDNAELALNKGDDYTARVDGIPIGADCTIAEDGDAGSYGEDSRTVDPGSVTILHPAGPEDPVPGAQIVTITNRYDAHPVPPPQPDSNSGGGLPNTGSDVWGEVVAGLGALALGVLALGVGLWTGMRRRRRKA